MAERTTEQLDGTSLLPPTSKPPPMPDAETSKAVYIEKSDSNPVEHLLATTTLHPETQPGKALRSLAGFAYCMSACEQTTNTKDSEETTLNEETPNPETQSSNPRPSHIHATTDGALDMNIRDFRGVAAANLQSPGPIYASFRFTATHLWQCCRCKDFTDWIDGPGSVNVKTDCDHCGRRRGDAPITGQECRCSGKMKSGGWI